MYKYIQTHNYTMEDDDCKSVCNNPRQKYERIYTNEYPKCRKPKPNIELIGKCSCSTKCPNNKVICNTNKCENRSMNVECHTDYCENDRCANMFIQNARKDKNFTCKKFTVEHTPKKGMGLFTKQSLEPGSFVCEYRGEIITQKDYLTNRYRPGDHNYGLQLENNWIIDSSQKGNEARYINHSCNPNCETVKYIGCDGLNTICIFAVKHIAKNEELTFDYKWESIDGVTTQCHCESKDCRGVIDDVGTSSPVKGGLHKRSHFNEFIDSNEDGAVEEELVDEGESKENKRTLTINPIVREKLASTIRKVLQKQTIKQLKKKTADGDGNHHIIIDSSDDDEHESQQAYHTTTESRDDKGSTSKMEQRKTKKQKIPVDISSDVLRTLSDEIEMATTRIMGPTLMKFN